MWEVNFEWDSARFSSIWCPIFGVICYWTIIYSIQYHVSHRNQPYDVAFLQSKWNLFLSGVSAMMLIFTVVALAIRVRTDGFKWIMCEDPQTTPSGFLFFCSYIYYLSKYLEFGDTIFIALKGKMKGWGGLQVYHHSVVVFMAWNWVEFVQTLQFPGLVFNTSVHVVMYYYYYLTSKGKKVWWRKHVTQFQIVQFVTSLILLMGTMSYFFTGTSCAGMYALGFNAVFNITLLYEFVGLLKPRSKNRKFSGRTRIATSKSISEKNSKEN